MGVRQDEMRETNYEKKENKDDPYTICYTTKTMVEARGFFRGGGHWGRVLARWGRDVG